MLLRSKTKINSLYCPLDEVFVSVRLGWNICLLFEDLISFEICNLRPQSVGTDPFFNLSLPYAVWPTSALKFDDILILHCWPFSFYDKWRRRLNFKFTTVGRMPTLLTRSWIEIGRIFFFHLKIENSSLTANFKNRKINNL